MTQFRVRGAEAAFPDLNAPDPGRFRDLVSVQPGPAIRIGEVRGARLQELEVAPDAVVELELEDGLRLWTSGEGLQDHLEAAGHRGADGHVLLPSALRFGSPARGAGRWALRVLRLLKVDLTDAAAGMAATSLIREMEKRLVPEPGLYRFATHEAFGDRIDDRAQITADTPLLVFVHGTASNTSGSFGGLASSDGSGPWDRLARQYRENILAYEHRTLSESPIENALEIARRLPDRGAVLHLVTHSRGGLIGELLCRAQAKGGDPFPEHILQRFQRDGEARERDRDALLELGDLLRGKRPRVERFVRVACPARGTTLASGRLDFFLSLMLNLGGLIPGFRANPVYEFLTALTMAIVKKRTDPRTVPGIEAMMPTSPLIATLNEPGFEVDADLTVIAGDTQGSGMLGRLKVLATDLFYRENHDIVVQSGSMVGGAKRTGGARLYFDKGGDVSHFQYFRNPRSADKLVLGLTRAEGADAGFERITETTATELKIRAPVVVAGARPVIFLLPGIMGSHLATERGRLWIHLINLARGRFSELAIGKPGVQAQALVDKAYARLALFLSATHEVVQFPFDWRRSLGESADRLAAALNAKLTETRRPVRLLAHSMGGLVARAMIARHPHVWQRLVGREGGRLVMLGTPNGGSYVIPRVLLGQEQIFRYLVLLDLRSGQHDLLKIVAEFPGLLEMLPVAEDRDFFGDAVWQEMFDAWGRDWVRPTAEALEKARKLRAELATGAIDGRHMVYVAGRAPATPVGYRIDLGRRGRDRVQFLATTQGDGRVPWSTGRLPGVPTWYMDSAHGDMADHRPSFPALLELLVHGTTSLLRDQPPVAARGVEEVFVLPPEEVAFFPNEQDVEAAALGFEPTVRADEAEDPLQVAVVHGNLAFSPFPVSVGHYTGDTIAGAERVLDQSLDGRLSEKRQLNLYPGPVGTSEIVLRDDVRPPGAIVVGLGEVGALTGARLERSFAQAVLAYAAKVVEMREGRGISGPHSANVTALLIGSGRGGISIEDSVRAILNGTLDARSALRRTRLGEKVRIDRLELWELFEDVAILATRTVLRLVEESRFTDRIRLERTLAARTGGRRRAAFDEDAGWWDRLEVQADPATGALSFQSLTGRARAELRLVPQQRALVDRFLADATRHINDDTSLAITLFELLFPNALKDMAPDRTDLVLVVDEEAARYPWELLRDSESGSGDPMAVSRGLIRQLQTSQFRAQVSTPINANVLVVGDPITGTDEFPQLDGAKREAEAVVQVLGAGGYAVTSLIRGGFGPILQQLFARPYRILHLAAHGVYERELPPIEDRGRRAPSAKPNAHEVCDRRRTVTGVVLGDGVFLQPAEFEQMRHVPELVFLNCCHLGNIEPATTEFPQLAANVATQLIRMGVRAVVAAGWAVQDDAAVTFANTFYGAMLDGQPFGKAVQDARRETYRQHPGYNTWGAYQCYGDQGYVLRDTRGEVYAPPPGPVITCPSELVAELDNVVEDANATSQQSVQELRRRLREIARRLEPIPRRGKGEPPKPVEDEPDGLAEESLPEDRVEARWLKQAPVRAALARAYAQLDMFEDAIRHYAELAGSAKADFTVEALEQYANLRSRWALARWREALREGTGPGDKALPEFRAELQAEVENALKQLKALPRGEHRSSERWSLIGSGYKRLSHLSEGGDVVQALNNAARAYHAAHERAREERGEVNPYPLHNWLIVEVLLYRLGVKKEIKSIESLLAEATAAAFRKEAGDPSFWTGVGSIESELIRGLYRGDLAEQAAVVSAGYRSAWRRGGSALHLRSVAEHLDWLIDVLVSDGVSAQATAAADGAASGDAEATGGAARTNQELAMALHTIRAAVEALVETREATAAG